MTVQIFVTNAEHDAMRAEAERRVDAELEEKREEEIARQARVIAYPNRVIEVASMEPAPAVIVLGPSHRRQPWFNWGRAGWGNVEQGMATDGWRRYEDVRALLVASTAGDMIETFGSIDAYQASLS